MKAKHRKSTKEQRKYSKRFKSPLFFSFSLIFHMSDTCNAYLSQLQNISKIFECKSYMKIQFFFESGHFHFYLLCTILFLNINFGPYILEFKYLKYKHQTCHLMQQVIFTSSTSLMMVLFNKTWHFNKFSRHLVLIERILYFTANN